MKKIFSLLAFCAMFFGLSAQNKSDLPNITLKTLDGETVNVSEIRNDGKPFAFMFTLQKCTGCREEHDDISEVYDEWVEETGVKIYSVYIDDSRHSATLKPYVDGKNWPFEALHDVNKDLYRAFNINECPSTLLFDGDGKLVWRHSGYFSGDDIHFYEEIQKIANK